MGKKIKKGQTEEPSAKNDEMQEEEHDKKEPIEKWLPFNKYVNKMTKNQIRKRK